MVDKIKEFYRKNKKKVNWAVIILVIVGLNFSFVDFGPEEKSYNEFQELIKEEKVDTVRINLEEPTFMFKSGEKYYKTDNPKVDSLKKELLEADIKVVEVDSDFLYYFAQIASAILRIGLIIWVLSFLTKSMGGTDDIRQFAEGEGIPKITFDDVAGQEEAKEEMLYLVDFMKNPDKYKKQGAKLPKGAIFYGPPGTGKTLLAKAIAGEAKVPFFSANGSEFMEMYVGVGAKRVRALFNEARKNAPAIVFIDEIDSVGGKRTGASQNSEQQQTINALLNEMDGFKEDEEIIVIAATNRIQDLDTALVRPGRFDKHIAISLPDKKDRQVVLETYAKNKQLAEDIDLKEWAKLTTGFAGADLEALMNEAAILSVINEREEITYDDMDDAYYKRVMRGHKKKDQTGRKGEELEVVAWHEAGHALMAKKVQKSEVPKVTILSSTSGAGGVTFITPSSNPLPSKREMENRIKTLYAGRVAEYLLLGEENAITSGASSDIEEATKLIRAMISDYGMSDTVGMLNLKTLNGGNVDNSFMLKEARNISAQLYEEALGYLRDNKGLLEVIAVALLEKETLVEEELDSLITNFSS